MAENMRRLERERVLSLLYEAEMKGESAQAVLAELPVEPEEFVATTVNGVFDSATELDKSIDQYAIDWKTDRMASIDRSILRIGAWELKKRPELPVAVIISEAVELAKRFSTHDSGKFINGILSAMADDIRS